jgi:hypothetical protein
MACIYAVKCTDISLNRITVFSITACIAANEIFSIGIHQCTVMHLFLLLKSGG